MKKSSARLQRNDRLSGAIGVSIALHGVLLVFLTVRAVFFPSDPIILEDTIRVDIVALPEKTSRKNQLPPPAPPQAEVKPAPKPEPKPEPAPPPKPVVEAKPAPPPPPVAKKPEAPKVDLNKAKSTQEAALKRLEALERIQQMAKSEEAAKAAAAKERAAQQAEAAALVKGNELAAGNSLTGLNKLDHQTYLRSVDRQVKQHWNLPQWLANSSLSATVRLYIDSQGFVVKKEIVRSSGDPIFDERVTEAIEQASPLPPPPSNLANLLAVDGVELGFFPR